MNFSNESKITFGVVIIMMGLAFSYGTLTQRVENVDDRLASIERKIDNINRPLSPVASQ